MADDNDWIAQYELAGPETKKLIEKSLRRRDCHQWFQNIMQLLGNASGLAVSLYAIFKSTEVMMAGNWPSSIGASVLGGGTIVALAKTFTHAHRVNASLEEGTPPKKAVGRRRAPAKKTSPAKRSDPEPLP